MSSKDPSANDGANSSSSGSQEPTRAVGEYIQTAHFDPTLPLLVVVDKGELQHWELSWVIPIYDPSSLPSLSCVHAGDFHDLAVSGAVLPGLGQVLLQQLSKYRGIELRFHPERTNVVSIGCQRLNQAQRAAVFGEIVRTVVSILNRRHKVPAKAMLAWPRQRPAQPASVLDHERQARLGTTKRFVQAVLEWVEQIRANAQDEGLPEEIRTAFVGPADQLGALILAYRNSAGEDEQLLRGENLGDAILAMVKEGLLRTRTDPVDALEFFYEIDPLDDKSCERCKSRLGVFEVDEIEICAHCLLQAAKAEG